MKMKRLEVYYTDVEDIQSIVKSHYDYEYEYNYEDIPGDDSSGTKLFDMTGDLDEYMEREIGVARQEMMDEIAGEQYIEYVLRVLVEDGHLESAHYLVEATWG